MSKVILTSIGVALAVPAIAFACQPVIPQHLVCHESDGWHVTKVGDETYNDGIAKGDFDYTGPLSEGQATEGGDQWCADNVPVPPVTEDTPPIVETPPPIVTLPTLPSQPEPKGK